MNKIVLNEEKETLFIPLFGKAKENKKKSPILIDEKAAEIVSQIDYNFKSLKIPKKTNMMMCLRAKLIDNFVKDFLEKDSENVVLHLGCGLDSRCERIGSNNADWYDIDFKEVIDIRRYFYKETDHYHLIASSVTEFRWIEIIPRNKRNYIVIAEGLFMYMKEDEIKLLINRLRNRIGSFILTFDAFSAYTAKKIKNHPSLKKTGAAIHWGIDNPVEFTGLGTKIQLIQEKYFTSNEEVNRLNRAIRIIFRIANLFPAIKKAQRLLIYKVF